jgi:hypothetical protein
VWKLHSACINHTLRVEITLCVYKSHSAFENCSLHYTRACVHHSMRMKITKKIDLYTQSAVLTRISVIIDDLNQGSARKEPKNQHKEPNFMDILIKFEKNTLISVLSRIIFITKKSPPAMKRAIL